MDLTVPTVQGQGSTFTMRLPVHAGSDEVETGLAAPAGAARRPTELPDPVG